MTHLHIANAAIFFAIAVAHVCRLSADAPVSIGSFAIPLWMSAVAIIGAALMAWLNWRAIHQPGKTEWLKFLLALFIIDAVAVFFSWQMDLSYWQLAPAHFSWILLFDLIVIGVIYWSLKKK